MSTIFEPPPNFSIPVLVSGPDEGIPDTFSSPWMRWFLELTEFINNIGGGGIGIQHNSALGLQGGTTGEYYHITAAEFTVLSNLTGSGALVGRFSAGAGPIEEIQLGSNLSLTGNVLNAAGGGGGSGTVTNSGNLDLDQIILGNNGVDVKKSGFTLATATVGNAVNVFTTPVALLGDWFPTFAQTNSATFQGLGINGSLKYNPNTGTFTANTFVGGLAGTLLTGSILASNITTSTLGFVGRDLLLANSASHTHVFGLDNGTTQEDLVFQGANNNTGGGHAGTIYIDPGSNNLDPSNSALWGDVVVNRFSGKFGIGTTPVSSFQMTLNSLPAGSGQALRIRNTEAVRYRSDFAITSGGLAFNAFDDTGGVFLPITVNTTKASFTGSAVIKGPRPWIDITAYGALVNDSTSGGRTTTTASINAALAAASSAAGTTGSGGTVFIPPGRFYINGTINLPLFVSLRGAGRTYSIIQSNVNGTMLHIDTTSGRSDYIDVSDFALINDSGGTSVVGILADGPNLFNSATFHDLHFNGIYRGIKISVAAPGQQSNIIRGCLFDGGVAYGIDFEGDTGGDIISNNVIFSSVNGIRVAGASVGDLTISGNNIDSPIGIYAQNTSAPGAGYGAAFVITGNKLEGTQPLSFLNITDSVVSGNRGNNGPSGDVVLQDANCARNRIDINGCEGVQMPGPLIMEQSSAAGRVNLLDLYNFAAPALGNKVRIRLGPSAGFVGTDFSPYIESYTQDVATQAAGLAFGVRSITGVTSEAMAISAGGNVGIGAAPAANASLFVSGIVSSSGIFAAGIFQQVTLQPDVNQSAYGWNAVNLFTKAGSGTHPNFSQAHIGAPTIIGAGATVTNATTLLVDGAPSGGATNRALWVTGGLSEVDTIKITGGSPADGKLLVSDGSGLASWGGAKIGSTPITSGNPTSVLYESAGNKFAESANLTFDGNFLTSGGYSVGDYSWVKAANYQTGWGSGLSNSFQNILSGDNNGSKNAAVFTGRDNWTLGIITDTRSASPSVGYSIYIEAYKQPFANTNSYTFGIELDVINRNSNVPQLDPWAYNTAGSQNAIRLAAADLDVTTQTPTGTTNSNTTITGVSTLTPSDISIVGNLITGTDIPAGTHVTAFDNSAHTITLSQAATGSHSGSFTIRQEPYDVSAGLAIMSNPAGYGGSLGHPPGFKTGILIAANGIAPGGDAIAMADGHSIQWYANGIGVGTKTLSISSGTELLSFRTADLSFNTSAEGTYHGRFRVLIGGNPYWISVHNP